MGEKHQGGNPLEQFVLLAKNAKGAAAVELVRQALEAPGIYVFGELLDMANIQDLENTPHAPYLKLLNMFAYGTYRSMKENPGTLPDLSESMRRKLRLLTVVSLSETSKLLPYSLLQAELDISTVRELEDLVIEGISAGVVLGKLDQKNSHFEVDFVIGRDIRKIDIGNIVGVLAAWCNNCDSTLSTIESQVKKVNKERAQNDSHRTALEQRIAEVKATVKTQGGGEGDDPDSRMESERADRRDKKGGKGKGLRGSSKSGFWKQ